MGRAGRLTRPGGAVSTFERLEDFATARTRGRIKTVEDYIQLSVELKVTARYDTVRYSAQGQALLSEV